MIVALRDLWTIIKLLSISSNQIRSVTHRSVMQTCAIFPGSGVCGLPRA